MLKDQNFCPDWRGPVGWALYRRFDSQSGHMPVLQAQSPVGVRGRGNWLVFLPLSFSLWEQIHKIFKKKKKKVGIYY